MSTNIIQHEYALASFMAERETENGPRRMLVVETPIRLYSEHPEYEAEKLDSLCYAIGSYIGPRRLVARIERRVD